MIGYFEEINENKHLTLVPTNESEKKKYEELWIKIRDLIRWWKIYENQTWYRWQLPLNKTIPLITIVVRPVFHENNKYYHLQDCLDECLYEI